MILFILSQAHPVLAYNNCGKLAILTNFVTGNHAIRNAISPVDTARLYKNLRLVDIFLDKSAAVSYSSPSAYKDRRNYSDSAQSALKRLMDDMTSLSDKRILLEIYEKLGGIYQRTGNYTTAMDFYFDALGILDSDKDIDEKRRLEYYSQIYRNISICFSYNNFDKANLYQRKSIAVAKEYLKKYPGDVSKKELLYSQNNMGTLYLNYGKMSEAEKYYIQALALLRNMKGLEKTYCSIYNNMGIISYEKGERQKSLAYFNESLKLCRQYEDQYNLANTLLNLGELFRLEKKYTLSIQKADSAMELCKNDPIIIYKALLMKSDCLENLGDMKGSLVALKDAYSEKEKIDGKETIQLSLSKELDYLYNTYHRSRDAKLAKERYSFYAVIGIVLFLLVVVYLLYRNQKVLAQKKIIAEKNLKLSNDNLMLENQMLQQDIKQREKEANLHIKYMLEKKKTLVGRGPAKTVELDADVESSPEELEVILQGMHESFYKNLYKKHPDLTRMEKRLSSFLRLGLSTKEIAAITHQQVTSVEMARSRLRAALGLQRKDNLVTYLQQF